MEFGPCLLMFGQGVVHQKQVSGAPGRRHFFDRSCGEEHMRSCVKWPDSTHSSGSAACPRARDTAGKNRALTVGRATVRAHRNLLARIDDSAMLGLPPQMVVLHFAKVRQGRCVLIWRQQQPTARLADAGQARDDGLEVTLMEHLSQWPHTPSGIRM